MSSFMNLYPPILDTYMPAFNRADGCTVYFSISEYNSIRSIKNAQVSVRRQNSNESVIAGALKNGIKIYPIQSENGMYYIKIPPSDIIGGFEPNQYYKVQIRFTPVGLEDDSDQVYPGDGWLTANANSFSEWSRVCLIRGIEPPVFRFPAFEDAANNVGVTISASNIDVVGTIDFGDEEQEIVSRYQVKLFNGNTGELLSDSGDIYTGLSNNPNQLNYTVKYNLVDGEDYRLSVSILTKNLYQETKNYAFSVMQEKIDKLEASISATPMEDRGSILIKLKSKDGRSFIGNITVRRASSRTNFTVWEDVLTTSLTAGGPIDFAWEDKTVESGVWYKYCAQRRNSLGHRGVIISTPQPVLVMYEDMFIVGDNKQLKINYNQAVSSYKRNIAENKADTIGSVYPYIKRNGAMRYKVLPISGLISFTSEIDREGNLTSDSVLRTKDTAIINSIKQDELEKQFSDTKELFGSSDNAELYDKYNSENNITIYNDYIQEREYREKVLDFLYEDKFRLLKTLTEGNLLVKIMDINLTPEATLGRMVYSFSATAYEVDECTIDNCDKYGIQSIGSYSKNLSVTNTVLGQIVQEFEPNVNIINTLLQEKYKSSASEGFAVNVQKLTHLKFEIESAPYLIKESGGRLSPLLPEEEVTSNVVLGHIAEINGTSILIPVDGIYELKGDNVEISTLSFPVKTLASLDYKVVLTEEEDMGQISSRIIYTRTVGQLWGVFNYRESIYNTIRKKYLMNNENGYRKLASINGVRIEANPGTVVYIQETKDTALEKHIINDTCSLQLYDIDSTIEGLFFGGVHLDAASEQDLQRYELPETSFIDTGITISSLDEVSRPVRNGVYLLENTNAQTNNNLSEQLTTNAENNEILENGRYIFYNNLWYKFSDDNDVICSVDGLVDYIADIMEGAYVAQ